MYAAGEMDGGFFFSYSDIVFAPRRRAAAGGGRRRQQRQRRPIVDRRWADAYVGRTLHPIPEAELARVPAGPAVPADQAVTRVGKLASRPRTPRASSSAWPGSPTPAARALREVWQQAVATTGLEAPFGRAKALRNAYLTDALNAMAEAGVPPAAGVHRRPVARDRHRSGSGGGRTARRALARPLAGVPRCRPRIPRTGCTGWTRTNGWRRRPPIWPRGARPWQRRAIASGRDPRPPRGGHGGERRAVAGGAPRLGPQLHGARRGAGGRRTTSPTAVRDAARLLRETPPQAPALVKLGTARPGARSTPPRRSSTGRTRRRQLGA